MSVEVPYCAIIGRSAAQIQEICDARVDRSATYGVSDSGDRKLSRRSRIGRMLLRILALAVMSLIAAAPDAAADWVRLRSANFTFIGDAPEAQIRAIARQAEQFREVMLRLLPLGQRPSM